MKKNFYILLVIVSINQIFGLKLIRRGYKVVLSEEENAYLSKEIKGFGDALTLSGLKCLDYIKNESGMILKACYDKYKNAYESEIESFNTKITELGKNLNSALPVQYLQQVNAARKQLTNIVENIKEFPIKLSNALTLPSFAKKEMTTKSFEVEKYLKEFYAILLMIHKSGKGIKGSEFQCMAKEITNEMRSNMEKIVQLIKKCREEN